MARKSGLLRWLKYKYVVFLRIKDSPVSIATGAALGISFDVLPTFGLGVFFAYFLAVLLKVNRIATVIAAVVFKLAIPFFIFLNYQTGQIITSEANPVDWDKISMVWKNFDWSHLGTSFLLGSVINSLVIFAGAYLITYYFIIWRRSRTGKTGPGQVKKNNRK